MGAPTASSSMHLPPTEAPTGSSSMHLPPTEAPTAIGIGGSATAQAFTIAESGDNSWDEEEESLGELSNTAKEALDLAGNQTPTQTSIPVAVVPAQRDTPSP